MTILKKVWECSNFHLQIDAWLDSRKGFCITSPEPAWMTVWNILSQFLVIELC